MKKLKKKGNTGHRGGQFENKNAEKWTEKRALKLGEKLIKWISVEPETIVNEKGSAHIYKMNLFITRFLIENRLDDSLAGYLAGKFKSFAVLLKRARKIQEYRINEYGLLKYLDSSLVKFNLINHHGYQDKHDLSLSKLAEAEKIKFEW